VTLVTRDLYRSMSGDTSAANSDETVDLALVTAQQLLEDVLDRGLESMSRIEIVMLHQDGRAYPHCTPITSVTSPVGVVQRDQAILGLWPQQNPLWDILYEPYRYGPGGGGGMFDTTAPIATITYVGGYTLANLPRKLLQAIVDLAKVEMTIFDPTLAGVSSASVGDVRTTYANSPDRAGVTAAILHEVRGFKRREIGH
jgi:hypothetical protein